MPLPPLQLLVCIGLVFWHEDEIGWHRSQQHLTVRAGGGQGQAWATHPTQDTFPPAPTGSSVPRHLMRIQSVALWLAMSVSR